MKFFVAFVLLIAGISVQPEPVAERNLIADQVVEAIEEISQSIKDRGLDPLYIRREAGVYALPVPVIFNAAGFCEDVLSTGLSNIVFNQINYNILTFTLTFDIELPHIHLSADIAAGEVVVFDNLITGTGSGSIDVYNVNVKGSVRVGVLGGIGVRTAEIDFTLGGIDSQVNLNIHGYDLGTPMNSFLNVIVPNTLDAFKSELDELFEVVLINFINENLL